MKNLSSQALMLLLLTAATGLGCGGPGSSVHGAVSGVPFTTVNSALSAKVITSSKGEVGFVVLANAVNLCSKFGAGAQDHLDQRVEITLYAVDANKMFHAPTEAGTFNVDVKSAGPYAAVTFAQLDSSCQALSGNAVEAVSGTVKLTGVSGGDYSGSFDVTFPSGDHLTGTFEPSGCDAVATAYNHPEALSCH